MPKYSKNHKDVEYYVPKRKKKSCWFDKSHE